MLVDESVDEEPVDAEVDDVESEDEVDALVVPVVLDVPSLSACCGGGGGIPPPLCCETLEKRSPRNC
ncbi:hypothetical protein [Trinickia acidisoli]|uniref:hypothetical protein n=1 Tax=Trinickia acidisoli TaxID=2767482 RepID=UPI001A8FE506|nr:hypothetical protein [Trinickia acidisoli]